MSRFPPDRLFRWAAIAGAAALLLQGAWVTFEFGGGHATLVFIDASGFVVPLAAALGCWRAASLEQGRMRRAWHLLGGSVASWGLGQVVWSWYEIVAHREVPFPSLADVGFLGLLPLAAAGLLSLSAGGRPRAELRTLLDGLVVGGSLLLLGWVMVVGPVYRAGSEGPLREVLSLAYPVGDVVLVAIVMFLLARSPEAVRLPLVLLGAGFTVLAVADSAFSVLTLNNTFATGSVIDIIWSAGFILVGLAGVRHRPGEVVSGLSQRYARRQALLPYGVVVLSTVVAGVEKVRSGTLEPVLFWMLVAVILIVAARQSLSLLDHLALSHDLEAKVEARTAERAALEARLHEAERMESLGRLAGGIAHDFNNLLAVIVNYAEFVTDELPHPPPPGLEGMCEQIRSDVEAISQAADRAGVLTRQLLVFARRDVSHPRVLDLNRLVTGRSEALRHICGETTELIFELAEPPPLVVADPVQLEQVLVSLAANAREAMEEGGRVTITTERVVDLARPEAYSAGLTVADTGRGMAPEVAARAFEPFFTTKPKGQGAGLGLATVFGVVTDAGGQVAIDSRPGGGTAVHIQLPAVEERRSRRRPPAALPEGRGETILVVEDEGLVLDAATRLLRQHGYEVIPASGGDAALRICSDSARPVDLLLTDVIMPGLSGPQVAAQVRALRPGVPVVYMSGYTDSALSRAGVAGEALVSKPFTAQSLLDAVRRALATVVDAR